MRLVTNFWSDKETQTPNLSLFQSRDENENPSSQTSVSQSCGLRESHRLVDSTWQQVVRQLKLEIVSFLSQSQEGADLIGTPLWQSCGLEGSHVLVDPPRSGMRLFPITEDMRERLEKELIEGEEV